MFSMPMHFFMLGLSILGTYICIKGYRSDPHGGLLLLAMVNGAVGLMILTQILSKF